jgi:tRNA threonylcarbamoyladenosine biosynthesis protein TsaB
MTILAIDATGEWCSAAVGDAGGFVERCEHVGQRHAERMLPLVQAALREYTISITGLQGIAFGAGPGSFTGLRIACGIAQGLAFGAGLPVVAVGSLEAIAESARRDHGAERVVAALDARMQQVYIGMYVWRDHVWHPAKAPIVVDPASAPVPEGDGWFGAGNAYAAYPALADRLRPAIARIDASIAPRARDVGVLALPRFAGGDGVRAQDAAPLYVRQRVALTTAERRAGQAL